MPEFARYPSLAGRAVVVTGGATGIGEEIVRAFAEQDAAVGFIDRDADAGHAPADDVGAHFALADLTDISALRAAIASCEAANGAARVLVNNAARDDRHDWRDVSPDYWDERIQTNLRHAFFAIQAVAPGMAEAGGGSIVNMGSNSWHESVGNFPAYATAKAGIEGLTRTMARDLGPDRIRVNTVVPGWIMTERQKNLWLTPEGEARHKAAQCIPEMIDPVWVARMVLFLASDDSAMCTAGAYNVTAGSM
ncbi:SDR family NAD(P)-dependent oxidoreductase [Maritimibacter dapengensis]|uniref:SDR family oxidoreductase n=1 Tax=Maritimibacter dapengensis TaxID=2836868 RepID=A0ABS6SYX2_9RHOB|nr:SDR family oxidoreductase [Maritimibacter dapengensis]MBV7378175.1 SDR family oxidoreductase [Maritimibacter dapengensis]